MTGVGPGTVMECLEERDVVTDRQQTDRQTELLVVECWRGWRLSSHSSSLLVPALMPTQDGADTLCRQLIDDSQLSPRLKALRARELARGLDPELLRRFVLYVRRYRYPVSACVCAGVKGALLSAKGVVLGVSCRWLCECCCRQVCVQDRQWQSAGRTERVFVCYLC